MQVARLEANVRTSSDRSCTEGPGKPEDRLTEADSDHGGPGIEPVCSANTIPSSQQKLSGLRPTGTCAARDALDLEPAFPAYAWYRCSTRHTRTTAPTQAARTRKKASASNPDGCSPIAAPISTTASTMAP